MSTSIFWKACMEFLQDFYRRNVKRSFYKNRILALDLTIKCWSPVHCEFKSKISNFFPLSFIHLRPIFFFKKKVTIIGYPSHAPPPPPPQQWCSNEMQLFLPWFLPWFSPHHHPHLPPKGCTQLLKS